MTLKNSFYLHPPVHLPPCLGIYTYAQSDTNIHEYTNMHKHGDTTIAEQQRTSPYLTCSLICFRGDCLFLICCMYCMCSLLHVSSSTNFSISLLQWLDISLRMWNLQDPTKKKKKIIPVAFPKLVQTCKYHHFWHWCTVSFVYAVNGHLNGF